MSYLTFDIDAAIKCPIPKELRDDWINITNYLKKIQDIYTPEPEPDQIRKPKPSLVHQLCFHQGKPEPCKILDPTADLTSIQGHIRITALLPIKEPVPKELTDLYTEIKSNTEIIRKYASNINQDTNNQEQTTKFQFFIYRLDDGRPNDPPTDISNL